MLSAPGAFPYFKHFVTVLSSSAVTEVKLVKDSEGTKFIKSLNDFEVDAILPSKLGPMLVK